MIQSSNANVKLVVASPSIINNDKFQREFEKVAISQRRLNFAMHGEFVDGERILNDPDYVDIEFNHIITRLLERVKTRGKAVGVQTRLEPPKPNSADEISEELSSNLFEVTDYPVDIFASPTSYTSYSSIYEKLGDRIDSYSFLLKRQKLYAFDDLRNSDSPFIPVISGKVVIEKSLDWIEDKSRSRELIELFNQALRKYCKKRGVNYDKKHHRFVCRLQEGRGRSFRWRSRVRYTSRTIAEPMKGQDGNVLFCKHYAANLRFMVIDSGIFLRISPTMTFTSDGYKPIRSKELASLMSRYLSRQFNNEYLDSVRFWAKFLSKLDTKISLPTGGPQIMIDTIPISIRVNVGIAKEGVD